MTPRSRRAVGSATLAGAGLAALVLGFAPDGPARLEWFYAHAAGIESVGIAFTSVLCAVAARRTVLHADAAALRNGVFVTFALSLLVVAITLASPPVMRVQADESLVAAAAFGLWTGAGPTVPVGLYDPSGDFHALMVLADKRGLLLPTLIATLHFTGGFAFEHGFAVNIVAGLIALLGVYALARRWSTPAVALASCFIVAAWPVFAWAATGQSLECTNFALLVWTTVMLARGIESDQPSDYVAAAALGALLAGARYESVVVGVVPFCAAAVAVRRAAFPARWTIALAVVPLLYLPWAWQRGRAFDYDLARSGEDVAFGLGNLATNALRALRVLLEPTFVNPNGPIALALAAVGVALLLRGLPKKRPIRGAMLAHTLAVLGVILLTLSFAWAKLDHAETARLGLPLMGVVALAAGSALAHVARLGTWGGALALLVAGVCVAHTVQTLPRDWSLNPRPHAYALEAAASHLAVEFRDCRLLVVSTYAPYWVLRGHAAVGGPLLAAMWPDIRHQIAAWDYDGIALVQIIDRRRGVVDLSQPPDGFVTRPVAYVRLGAHDAYAVKTLQSIDSPFEPRKPCAAWGGRNSQPVSAPRTE